MPQKSKTKQPEHHKAHLTAAEKRKHRKELEEEIKEIREENEGHKMSQHDKGKLGIATRKLRSLEKEGDEYETFHKGALRAGHTRHKAS